MRARWGLALATLSLAGAAHATPACTSNAADETAVVQVTRDLFTAVKADDEAKFSALTMPGFYAFDGGKRFDGLALFQLIKAAHAAGARYEWSVNEPKVLVDCQTALVTYVNKGSLENEKGRQDLTWLESVTLRRDGGKWRIAFLHSTRATAP